MKKNPEPRPLASSSIPYRKIVTEKGAIIASYSTETGYLTVLRKSSASTAITVSEDEIEDLAAVVAQITERIKYDQKQKTDQGEIN